MPRRESCLNGTFSCLAALTFLLACLVQRASAAETNAVIPYEALDEMFQPIAKIDPSKLEIRVFVASNDKAVRASDISLTIQRANKSAIPVRLNTNGQILKFPQTPELRRENPPIISNQRKGTLNLRVAMQLPLPDGLTFRYRRLGDGVAEMNKAIKAQAGMLSLLAPKVQGVIFFFDKASAGKASVEIASASGRKKYTADKLGQVKLKLENTLVKENPEVKVSETPGAIAPDMSVMK